MRPVLRMVAADHRREPALRSGSCAGRCAGAARGVREGCAEEGAGRGGEGEGSFGRSVKGVEEGLVGDGREVARRGRVAGKFWKASSAKRMRATRLVEASPVRSRRESVATGTPERDESLGGWEKNSRKGRRGTQRKRASSVIVV